MNAESEKNSERELESLDAVNKKERKIARTNSSVIGGVNKFSSWLYRLFISGLFGSIFTLYSKLQKSFKAGFVSSVFADGGIFSPYLAKARYAISRSIEKSRLLGFLNKKLGELMSVNLSVFGLFIMIFGGLSAVFGILDSGLSGADILSSNEVLIGAILVLSSFPLMASSKTLVRAIKEGRILRWLIIDVFGISEESLGRNDASGRETVPIAIVLGVVFGAISYFTGAALIICVVLILLGVYLVMKYPEIGVLCTFFVLPFTAMFERGQGATILIVCVTLASYFVKVLCGRRRIRLELLGTVILIFALILSCGGLFSAGDEASSQSAAVLTVFAFSYIALVNLLRSKAWLKRAMYALAVSSVIMSVLTLLEFFAVKQGIFPSVFGRGTFINGALTELFADKESTSAYMILIFPMLLFIMFDRKRLIGRFATFVGILLALFSVVYLGSRPAWLGLAVGILLFMMLYNHKTLTALIIAALPAVCSFMFIPSSVKARIFDFFKFSHNSVSNRFEIWDGGLKMIREYLFGGIGVGESAFCEVYPAYANAGFENATSLYNVYLQILAALGIVGLIAFVIMIILFAQKSLCFMKYNEERTERLPALVCLCSAVSLLTMGAAYDVFSDVRIFLAFFMIMGVGCAYIRIGDDTLQRSRMVTDPHDRSADLIIDFKY